MLIRSARICCLCYKRCGTNIEVAHIRAEADGGQNDDANAIPLCFDCHQETGGYNDRHPKGNKFSIGELLANRERLYRLVDSGALAARVVAAQIAGGKNKAGRQKIRNRIPATPSAEASILTDRALVGDNLSALGAKLNIVTALDRAAVLDALIEKSNASTAAVKALGAVLSSGSLGQEDETLVAEQMLRRVTLSGTTQTKAGLLENLPVEALASADEGVRSAFFRDLIEIMKQDQFDDVNRLTSPLTSAQGTIPAALWPDYVKAVLAQAESLSFNGAPAARRALDTMPATIAKAAFKFIDARYLVWNLRKQYVRGFISARLELAPRPKRKLVADFVRLSPADFTRKYDPE